MISSVLKKGKVNSKIIDKIYKLIIATQHDILLKSNDEKLIVDIDLAILGKSKKIFDQYNRAIRKEYFWVPEDIYLKERKKVLLSFYNRESIYYHKEITVQKDGTVTGTVGEAKIVGCQISLNRNDFERYIKVKTDYIIKKLINIE